MTYESIESVVAALNESLSKIETKQRQLAELSKQLQAHRATSTSEDKTVRATVDGNGRLRDLHISDEAMSQTHPERLGRKVTQAVRSARGEATSANSANVAAALPFTSPERDEDAETSDDPHQLDEKRVEVSIDGGVGTVVADAFGRLRGVKINPKAVSYTTASRLAPRILAAIQQADKKARKLCMETIAPPER